MLHPSLDEFNKLATPGALVPIYKEILADLETPVSAYMKVALHEPYSFLLESVERAENLGQYSIIGTKPETIFRSKGQDVCLIRNGCAEHTTHEKPLELLRNIMSAYKPVPVKGLPAFHGGAVGYISYDYVRFFEQLPDNKPDVLKLPDLYFVITDTLLIFDHVRNKIIIVSNVHVGDNVESAYEDGAAKIIELERKLKTPLPPLPREVPSRRSPEVQSNFTRESFCDAVRAAKEYIAAGDVFQVVLSQRFRRQVSVSPLTLYRALRCINPSPYMLLMRFPELGLVGSSPEVMTQVKQRRVMVRPIAGTRPRGASHEEDNRLEDELLADEKERAEHIMLVDLGRNDIGRVSDSGTVAPVADKLMVIERYSHVMHIVSEVAGTLSQDKDAFDAIEATFPMGTVSGAPKIRAMEIIDQLEPERRGPYSGGCGYISFDGEMDTCILIRTMVIKDGVAYVQAGAGIVYDSDPESEYEETVNKAKGVFRAIDFAEKGLDS